MIHHHVIRCFGSGESHIESLLPDIIKRGRDPLVGITASGGTISLRLTTRAESVDQCLKKMSETQATVESILGDLVFGYNDDLLETVVAGQLKQANTTLAVHDAGLHGDVAAMLLKSGGNITGAAIDGTDQLANQEQVLAKAQSIVAQSRGGRVLVIGNVDRSEDTVKNGESQFSAALVVEDAEPIVESFSFAGHSATRQMIACKRVLNFVRLQQRV